MAGAPERIVAFSTSRGHGISKTPFNSFNVAKHVGDDDEAVDENRQRIMHAFDDMAAIQWLDQVHGIELIHAQQTSALNSNQYPPQADACFTDQVAIACTVMTADCLPVLICNQEGTEVAAVHAGWRGLAAGVIEQAVKSFNSPIEQLLVWLGPAIGQPRFEVGHEVLEAFMQSVEKQDKTRVSAAFHVNKSKKAHFYADLYELARICLGTLGVTQVYGGGYCTYGDRENFYSYRRDGVCGRMATMIYIKP